MSSTLTCPTKINPLSSNGRTRGFGLRGVGSIPARGAKKKRKEKAMIDLDVTFQKYFDDYLDFERVEDKLNLRPDLCAFLLLDKLLPSERFQIICSAEHDIIYLDIDCEKLSEIATENDILMLTRCGVHYDKETDSLAMHV